MRNEGTLFAFDRSSQRLDTLRRWPWGVKPFSRLRRRPLPVTCPPVCFVWRITNAIYRGGMKMTSARVSTCRLVAERGATIVRPIHADFMAVRPADHLKRATLSYLSNHP